MPVLGLHPAVVCNSECTIISTTNANGPVDSTKSEKSISDKKRLNHFAINFK